MKQAIILRNDLGMGKGKIAAQACHASVIAVLKTQKKDVKKLEKWKVEGQKKIVLKVNSKKELVELFELAKKKTNTSLVKDAGLTQLTPGECTAVGIGPDKKEIIDSFVSHLKLL
ncbi:MAG: peptidyl-tRNA hydrolase [Nanoarchaeota archaeon]|nr:peptidyl-tRNA hydrolase [Nanoarchaeota archaeon]